MKIKKTGFIIIVLIAFFINTKAQNQYSELIYEAYIHNNMEDWKNVCDKMQQSQNMTTDSLINLINFQYGYIAWCMGNENQKDAIKYLELAEKNLQLAQNRNYNPSMVMSYNSAFNAFRAGLDNNAALKSGLNSLKFAESAIKEDSTNYFAFFQRANVYRHTPKFFSGSKTKAIEYYLKAESLISKDISVNKKNWNYLNLLVAITETYIEVEDSNGAKKYCDKILKIEPDIYLLNDICYPQIKRNTKQ